MNTALYFISIAFINDVSRIYLQLDYVINNEYVKSLIPHLKCSTSEGIEYFHV